MLLILSGMFSSFLVTATLYRHGDRLRVDLNSLDGNGKRSGPLQKSLDSTNVRDLSARQYSLRDLLLPEGFASRVPTNNELLLDARDVDTDVDSLYPDIEGYARAKDLEKARMMLSELMFQRHARNSLSSDFVDFKR
ncbi:hypothetical protein MAR_018574 [Mya arenaria]|uniref:Uncharacterized protein n=1 Tax=Mya arenaria TaxID=6604 RepID=A0ABY7EII1_MYAAR|nr:hypothetical protein MAR_018574 [Mya arenaria]